MSTCSKIPYPDHAAARQALRIVRRKNAKRGKPLPTTVHFCGPCRSWHLASKSRLSFPLGSRPPCEARAQATRRHDQRFHWMDFAAALIGLTAAILGFTFGTYAVRSPTGMLDEQVGTPAFVFGGVALLAVFGDQRMMPGRIQGARRIARHL